ncbi:threonine-phosphate decarboxylase [Roseibium denhamense]|uniref:threonine-phosphate decarboxylase n=1 Tax=Roseibium denhamense TaxID=76305 RepID=A0ABY1PED3_9HYPH|nr:threonine-phosphate decarboxylase CobD [Roseibium denhamense]MTI07833.1 threonine-phosphate decarboxylase [Roseibium denhamense]SMP31781.1 L-threonine O-3-phosphate decarboxylase [Roseibium denhamense]
MEHGGDLTRAIDQYGGTFDDWLDLSTGINPHTYPVPNALSRSAWTDLPGQAALDRLIAAARKAYRVPDHFGIVAGPGTQVLLSLLPETLPEGPVSLASPTYGSHKKVWTRSGRTPTELSSVYALPADAKIVLLVNPNNPDGRLVDVKSLLEMATVLTGRGGCLVLDEAFADTVPGASILPHVTDQNVLVLRSFGKFFGLAGLRLGFLAGPPALIQKTAGLLESWCLSGPAIEFGTAALRDADWQTKMNRQLADEMADLTLLLNEHHLSVFGGTPLYALAGLRKAVHLHEALARRHIWTRIFDYAPTWLRLGLPGSKANFERLSDALAEAQKEL